jgi:hypothetical protein
MPRRVSSSGADFLARGEDAAADRLDRARQAPHLCHAEGCGARVPPRVLMCLPHWRLVPAPLQRAVWDAYRPGQEIDKRPSEKYLEAAKRAIAAVAAAERRQARPQQLALWGR